MTKPTTSNALALKRLSALLGWKVQKGNALRRDSDGLSVGPRSATEALAFLAWLAQRPMIGASDAPKRVNWTGRPPSKGLSGWEDAALNWLSVRS